MEPERGAAIAFAERERPPPSNFAAAARRGGRAARSSTSAGWCPAARRRASRTWRAARGRADLLDAVPDVGRAARVDRDRRALALVPLPRAAGRARARDAAARLARYRTQPIDERDVIAYPRGRRDDRARARRALSLDIAGPDVAHLRRARRAHPRRAAARAPAGAGSAFNLTPVASRVAAAIAGEDPELVGPLMEGLDGDLLPRDDPPPGCSASGCTRFDAAIERALRDWEAVEELAAR